MRTDFVRARIEPHLKQEAEHILNELGITPTQAIKMLYKQIALQHSWPIDLKVPNFKTKQAFEETDQDIGLTKSTNVDEMFKKLGI